MAGALAGSILYATSPSAGVSTRVSSSAIHSAFVKKHRFERVISFKDCRKDLSGHMPDAAPVVGLSTAHQNVVSRREAMNALGAGLGAFLLVRSISRADEIPAASAAGRDLSAGLGAFPNEGELAVIINSWQSWVTTWLV